MRRALAATALLLIALFTCAGFTLRGGSGQPAAPPPLTCVGGTTDGSCVLAGDFTSTITDSSGCTWKFYRNDPNYSALSDLTVNCGSGFSPPSWGGAGTSLLRYNTGRMYLNSVWLNTAAGNAGIATGWWREITNLAQTDSVLSAGRNIPIVTTTSPAPVVVSAGTGATSIGFTTPTDSFYASSNLTVKADTLPSNGTWTLSDGTTRITKGQTLTLAQLTGSKFVPVSTGQTAALNSTACYTAYDPPGLGNIACAPLTVKPTGLWAQPTGMATPSAGSVEIFQTAQPSAAGDVVGVRFDNPTASFTASISGATPNVLNVTGITSGWLVPGMKVTCGATTVTILAYGTAVTQTGAYTVSSSGAVGSGTCSVAATNANQYVKWGQAFRIGDVPSGSGVKIRNGGASAYAQLNCMVAWPDSSCQHGIVTTLAPAITAGTPADRLIATCVTSGVGANCPAAPTGVPSAATLETNGYETSGTISYKYPNVGSQTFSCHNILHDANSGLNSATIKTFITGPAVAEYVVREAVSFNSGALWIECDIEAYADGSTVTDVVFDNAWFFSTGGTRTDMVYNISFTQSGENLTCSSSCQATTANGAIPQFLFSSWCHEVRQPSNTGGPCWGTPMPNVVQDVSYLMATGAIQNYDLSYGAATASVTFGARANNQNPYAIALIVADMGSVSGRPDIAEIPGWCANHVISQNVAARDGCFINADVEDYIGISTLDESTGLPISATAHSNVVSANSGLYPSNGSWNANCSGVCANGNRITYETTHVPDLAFYPYLITGNYHRLYQLEQQANGAILYSNHTSNSLTDYDSSNSFSVGTTCQMMNTPVVPVAYGCSNQTRSIGWGMRNIAEAATFVPDADPLKSYFQTVAKTSVQGLLRVEYIEGITSLYGPMQGYIGLVGNNANGNGANFPFHSAYVVMGLDTAARVPMAGLSGEAMRMAMYVNDALTGSVTTGNVGFPTIDGPNYHSDIVVISGGLPQPATSWAQFYTNKANPSNVCANIAQQGTPDFPPNPSYNGTTDKCYGMIDFTYGGGIGLSDSAGPVGGYPELIMSTAGLAYNYTNDPEYLHAHSFIKANVNQVYGAYSDLGSLITDWRNFPQFATVPVLPDGQRLQSGNYQYDVTNGSPTGANNTVVSLTCSTSTLSAPCGLLAVVPSTVGSASTLTGKVGGTSYDIFNVFSVAGIGTALTSSGGAANMIGKATAGGFFFGGCGVQTMEETPGNDVMAGVANCAATSGYGVQTYQFDAVRASKTKQIGYKGHDGLIRSPFRTGTDKLRVSSTIAATAAAFIALCSTASGVTTCNMGGGETLTIYNATTAPVAADVTIF